MIHDIATIIKAT